jgi:Protein of unknown function (DUF2550)
MAAWQWLVESAGAVLLALLLYGASLVVRRRLLSRNGGTFELSVRTRPAHAGRGWVLGIGRYNGEALEWFRIFVPWPRPTRRWGREELKYVGRREPGHHEQFALYAGHLVVECTTASGPVELAMSPSALTGFQSWLEARPPGTSWSQPPIR